VDYDEIDSLCRRSPAWRLLRAANAPLVLGFLGRVFVEENVRSLRKYYPEGSNEPHFDATVAVEKALSWVSSIRERSFVGTESRLNIVFELLRQLAFGAETDPDVRLAELQRRRALLDEEIAQVSAGHVEIMDEAALSARSSGRSGRLFSCH
jgi:hypothetical protein